MAHSTIHLTVGLAVGTAVFLPAAVKALRDGGKTAPAFARWIVTSWALALFAIVPSLLRYLGVPPSVCSMWWMNLFLLYPMLERMKHTGMVVGEISIALGLTLQYVLLLVALRQALRHGIRREAL
jgi:hypothetical protein